MSTNSAAAAAAECWKKADKNPQKVSKDESSAIFKQKQQSCQKKRFYLRIVSILWWFWSSFDK
jgi:hypothetical protein